MREGKLNMLCEKTREDIGVNNIIQQWRKPVLFIFTKARYIAVIILRVVIMESGLIDYRLISLLVIFCLFIAQIYAILYSSAVSIHVIMP